MTVRPRLGLALGGGAVRGMAHVGVLTVLERAGIRADVVTGTSAGSILAACYAVGLTAEEMRRLAEDIGWRDMARLAQLGSGGLLTLAGLERVLVRELGDPDFAGLRTPCAVMATDVRTGELVALGRGRVAPAVCASCSVPGFFTPMEIGGRVLCDGGVLDNLPVTQARALGADYVIAVNLLGTQPRRPRGPLWPALTALGLIIRNAGGGMQTADCLISPAIDHLSLVRFSQREELMALGEAAAEACLPQILTALGG